VPFRTEHAARQEDPDQFTTCRRSENKLGPGVSPIFCRRRSDSKWILQTIRFDSKRFTPAEAKKWCEDHDFKSDIEAARK
jgi:hypothetical protein